MPDQWQGCNGPGTRRGEVQRERRAGASEQLRGARSPPQHFPKAYLRQSGTARCSVAPSARHQTLRPWLSSTAQSRTSRGPTSVSSCARQSEPCNLGASWGSRWRGIATHLIEMALTVGRYIRKIDWAGGKYVECGESKTKEAPGLPRAWRRQGHGWDQADTSGNEADARATHLSWTTLGSHIHCWLHLPVCTW